MIPPNGYGSTFPTYVTIGQQTGGDQGVVIYTIDGTDPTWTNGTHAGTSVVVTLNAGATVKAINARSSNDVSSITQVIFSASPAPPPPPPPDSEDRPFASFHHFAQVTRLSKAETQMPIVLYGFTGTSNVNPVLLGIYEADEPEPMYTRIKIPKWVSWIRMRYRLNTLNINKMTDVLNLKSRTALVTAMRALKALADGDVEKANALEAKAVQMISEEEMSRNPGQTFDLQYDTGTCWADPLQGRVQ
jgi:hypothetical protein